MIVLAAVGWLISETREWREKRRSLSSAGTIGELVVISGNDEMPSQTWFPLPREGVLGSVRSCDLVVPADGVRSCHLDFFWQDGVGLLIHPRSGCEVRVNDIVLNCKSDPESAPLTHGSSLQIGSAVLRLHLFAALDHTSASRTKPDADDALAALPPVPEPASVPPVFLQDPVDFMESPMPPNSQIPITPAPMPLPVHIPAPPFPAALSAPSIDDTPASLPVSSDPTIVSGDIPAPAVSSRPRRSDRWKEDWSE